MSGLRSYLFQGYRALQAALTIDSRHIAKGARGSHVRKIQTALTLVLRKPPCNLALTELQANFYGDTTAAAVLRFKSENNVINRAYQTKADDITGKMTMAALDDAVATIEATLSNDMLRIISRLDELLARDSLVLAPTQRARFERMRANALSLRIEGVPREQVFQQDLRRGIATMDTMALGKRSTVVLGFVPIVAAGAGAAIGVFLIAIGCAIAMILLVEIVVDAGTLGQEVNAAIQEALDAGGEALLDNIGQVDGLIKSVEQCKRASTTRSPECVAALLKFDAKVAEVVATRENLFSTLRELQASLKGSPKKLIWKILARRAEAAGKLMSKQLRELIELENELLTKCGCRFIHI